jgi:cytochrome c-type biogenesis protein CcmH
MRTPRLTASGAWVVAAVLFALASLTAAALTARGAPVTRAEQAHDIAAALHCPVCKDLSAADSPAPLARQMRTQIRQQLDSGASPEEIRQGFVAAYGPSVLMSPPNQGWGRAAHLAPLVLVGAAVLLGAMTVRRGLRSQAAADRGQRPAALTLEARDRVERALAQLRQEEP